MDAHGLFLGMGLVDVSRRACVLGVTCAVTVVGCSQNETSGDAPPVTDVSTTTGDPVPVPTTPPPSAPPRPGDGTRPPRLGPASTSSTAPSSDGADGTVGADWVAAPPPAAAPAPGVTPVLVTFFSHNERTRSRFDRFRTDPEAYAAWRSALIEVVRLFDEYGVRYSWQSDYVILEAITTFEADAVADDPDATDGLPILTWMAEEMGVSIEPHAHECITPPTEGDCSDRPYNYADVAQVLQDVSGIVPAPVIGGTSEAERSVQQFGACIRGNVYDVEWCPTILIGFAGAQGGHTTDDHHSGVWRPSGFDSDGFLVHDPDGPLLNVGRGYSIGLFSDTVRTEVEPLEFITGLAERLRTGAAEPDRVYTATLNFNEDALVDEDILPDLEAALAELAPLAADGRIVYANFPEVAAAWNAWYGGEPNIYDYAG